MHLVCYFVEGLAGRKGGGEMEAQTMVLERRGKDIETSEEEVEGEILGESLGWRGKDRGGEWAWWGPTWSARRMKIKSPKLSTPLRNPIWSSRSDSDTWPPLLIRPIKQRITPSLLPVHQFYIYFIFYIHVGHSFRQMVYRLTWWSRCKVSSIGNGEERIEGLGHGSPQP